MEIADDQQQTVMMLRAHVDAARRHREAALRYPAASSGWNRAARIHVERAATLSTKLCGMGAAQERDAAPLLTNAVTRSAS